MSRSMFGSIQYLGPDRYRVWWTDEGKRRSKVVHGTRDDAELLLATQRLGYYEPVPDQPWGSYYETRVKPTFAKLEPKTVSGYVRVWEVELKPRIAKTMVGSTTWRFAQRALLDIRATSVQRAAMRLWKKMCNMAVDDEILDHCPITRRIKLAPHRKREKHMLDAADVPEFLAKIEGFRHRRVVRLMLGGGPSVEEASAVVAEGVEAWEYRGCTYAVVRIDRGLVTVDGRPHLKTSAKNEFREGEVVIGEPWASAILADLPGEGPLCPGKAKYRTGGEWAVANYMAPTAIARSWSRWCEREGVDYIRLGDMRSVWSTWQAEAGSPDDLVQQAMGHAGKTTRGRNYMIGTRRGLARLADNLAELVETTAKEKAACAKKAEGARSEHEEARADPAMCAAS